MRRLASFFCLSLLMSAEGHAQYISGYAVEDHRACRASNLPGTISELEKFFGSPNFPDDMQKNFFWTNARVRGTEWQPTRDAFESGETSSGIDGVDSALIAYIASHGVTSNGRYSALMGGADAGGCYAKTSEISVGDQNLRYLILSTCQGLKIGTGDYPSAQGEKPNVTWANANAGLNCILGYSNNMVDADQYGDYLLEGLATTDDTLAEAFMRASRRITYSNIPAVMCFGPDNATAQRNLATARQFTSEKYGKGGYAYVYEMSRRLEHAFLVSDKKLAKIPRVIKVAPRLIDTDKLARRLMGARVKNAGVDGALRVYRQGAATLTVDSQSSLLTWRSDRPLLAKEMIIKDVTAARIATDFITTKRLVETPITTLMPTYIVDRGMAIDGKPMTVAKTVVFHQRLHGLTPLAEAGSVEVTIDADGQVAGVNAVLVDAGLLRISESLDVASVDFAQQQQIALARIQKLFPKAKVSVVEARLGYDVGDHTNLQERARVAVEVLFDVEQGGFTRRFAEKNWL